MWFHIILTEVFYKLYHHYQFWKSLWGNQLMPVIRGTSTGKIFSSGITVSFLNHFLQFIRAYLLVFLSSFPVLLLQLENIHIFKWLSYSLKIFQIF